MIFYDIKLHNLRDFKISGKYLPMYIFHNFKILITSLSFNYPKWSLLIISHMKTSIISEIDLLQILILHLRESESIKFRDRIQIFSKFPRWIYSADKAEKSCLFRNLFRTSIYILNFQILMGKKTTRLLAKNLDSQATITKVLHK